MQRTTIYHSNIMVGAIAAILIAIWYYRAALETDKNPVNSAGLGLILYFVPAVIWTVAVTPSLRDTVEHSQGIGLGMIVRYGYIAVGVFCAAWVKPRHFAKRESNSE